MSSSSNVDERTLREIYFPAFEEAVNAVEDMSLSHVVRLPELSELNIPEKQRMIRVRDEQIFAAIQYEHRTIRDSEGKASPGDYVLIQAIMPNGSTRELHIELGKKRFPDYERDLLNCETGQVFRAQIDGEETEIHISCFPRIPQLFTATSIRAICSIDHRGYDSR